MNGLKLNRNLLRLLLTVVLVGFASIGCSDSRQSTTGVCGTRLVLEQPASEGVKTFARKQGVRYPAAFANVVAYIRQEGKLPGCYLRKGDARRQGWRPGESLWKVAPGHSIGGDHFGNRERRLPRKFNGRYVESDVDYTGHKRGAKRLVYARTFSGVAPIWLTTDHYRSFVKVPE